MSEVIELTQGEAFELARSLNFTERGARIMIEDGVVKVSVDRDMWDLGTGRPQS